MKIIKPSSDELKIEIAYLQEDISSTKPTTAKFKIPTLVNSDQIDTIYNISNGNIINKSNGMLNTSYLNMDSTIDLYVPIEYIIFYGEDIIPAGTRFLVSFIAGNINDIKIIGRYDNSDKSNNIIEYLKKLLK